MEVGSRGTHAYPTRLLGLELYSGLLLLVYGTSILDTWVLESPIYGVVPYENIRTCGLVYSPNLKHGLSCENLSVTSANSE